MNRLSEIIERKAQRVAAAKLHVPLFALKIAARKRRAASVTHALWAALSNCERTNIIAEFKRRSPSKGTIRDDADAASIAKQYESGGASAISVLTEEDYFAGSLDDLRAVRETTTLPILRKDFVLDEFQVYESANIGADALLLIAAALEDETLLKLRKLTEDDLGMDALVEVHTAEELKRALACGARLIGVNNRDLTTFQVSLQTSVDLAAIAPREVVMVSESGIETSGDIEQLAGFGYRGFLIGETLMRADNPAALLQQFTNARRGAEAGHS